jgi:hypothetical protein
LLCNKGTKSSEKNKGREGKKDNKKTPLKGYEKQTKKDPHHWKARAALFTPPKRSLDP